MSKYNGFGRKLNEVVRASFSKYAEAEQKVLRAKERAELYPPKPYLNRSNAQDIAYQAKVMRAQADLHEAEANFNTVKKSFGYEAEETIKELRAELTASIRASQIVEPSKVDVNVMTLLQSGILRSEDYKKLMHDAVENQNQTMIRLIGKAVEDATHEAVKNRDDETARELSTLLSSVRMENGARQVQALDYLADVFHRCCANPSMMSKWDELTGETIETF